LAYIQKNCWNPDDLTVSIRVARRARARPADLPSTSAASTPASTSAAPSVPAQTDSQRFEAMLQSIHQGQIILLQSLQVVMPPGSIPSIEQFLEMVAWPGAQPSLHREDEGPIAQVPQHVEEASSEATVPEPFIVEEEEGENRLDRKLLLLLRDHERSHRIHPHQWWTYPHLSMQQTPPLLYLRYQRTRLHQS